VTSVLAEIARQLCDLAGDWSVAGDQVRGPGDTAVVLGPGHLEIGFVVNASTVVWDRVVGIDDVSRAVTVWTQTTAAAVIEMFTQQQQFAAQFGPDDADGLPGCHVILGPVLAFGEGDPSSLQHWAVGTLLPAALAETLTPHLDPAGVNGVTLFFGGLPGAETVDARVNGAANEDLRAALLAMDWPRQPAFARLFMLVHKA
jgi:hypothetical protein